MIHCFMALFGYMHLKSLNVLPYILQHSIEILFVLVVTTIFQFVVTTVCLKALLECDSWTVVLLFSCIGSILLWFTFLPLYSMVRFHDSLQFFPIYALFNNLLFFICRYIL